MQDVIVQVPADVVDRADGGLVGKIFLEEADGAADEGEPEDDRIHGGDNRTTNWLMQELNE